MVHLIYTYLTLFSVVVSYLYKLDNLERKIQKRLEKSEKLAAVANFIDVTGHFE
jgi:hypothetical protein